MEPYRALYRRFRPARFEQVLGQEPVARTLRNQVASGRVAHAFLFCGPRGTGKTSLAKIFAKAVNCLDPKDGEPCLKCANCLAAEQDNYMDVIEIDAASNNGVDEIRDLRDKVRFPPSNGKYKVYIIDEVHMLSTGAFNALLKTLEEPPAHAVFILATTEVQRLPATIVSRCQRFDFRRISAPVMVGRLRDMIAELKAPVTEDALTLVARAAEGDMRDCLSLLDQALSFSPEGVGEKEIIQLLGAADPQALNDLAMMMLRGDERGCVETLSKMMNQGADLGFLVRELAQQCRSLMIVKLVDAPQEILGCDKQTADALRERAKTVEEAALMRAIELLLECDAEIRTASSPRLVVEWTLLRIARANDEDSVSALAQRVAQLEKMLENGVPAAAVRAADGAPEQTAEPEPGAGSDVPPWETEAQDVPLPDEPPADPEEDAAQQVQQAPKADSGEELYAQLLKKVKSGHIALFSALQRGRFGGREGQLFRVDFGPEDEIYANMAEMDANRKVAEEALSALTGEPVRLQCRVVKPGDTRKKENDEKMARLEALFGKDSIEVID